MFLFPIFFLSIMEKVVFLQRNYGGTVAQLVEQRTENPRVTGSIPVGTTTLKRRDASRLFFRVHLDQPKEKSTSLSGSAFYSFSPK